MESFICIKTAEVSLWSWKPSFVKKQRERAAERALINSILHLNSSIFLISHLYEINKMSLIGLMTLDLEESHLTVNFL